MLRQLVLVLALHYLQRIVLTPMYIFPVFSQYTSITVFIVYLRHINFRVIIIIHCNKIIQDLRIAYF